MAGCLQSSISFLLMVCFISQVYCRPSHDKKIKVLNQADTNKYSDCGALLKAGYNISGAYRLTLNTTDVLIPCEFVNGQAFTIILRRDSNVLSFIQPWANYESGFGTVIGNYWAGLATIYSLTRSGQRLLQINAQDWSLNNRNAVYSSFYLGDRNSRYAMHVAGYSGSLPDDLTYHNNMPFSTYDAPDPYGCAAGIRAGWWYNYCSYALPTGVYYNGGRYTPPGSMYDGMYWKDWTGYDYSLKFISMTLSS